MTYFNIDLQFLSFLMDKLIKKMRGVESTSNSNISTETKLSAKPGYTIINRGPGGFDS